jgi:hypothetical protein
MVARRDRKAEEAFREPHLPNPNDERGILFCHSFIRHSSVHGLITHSTFGLRICSFFVICDPSFVIRGSMAAAN